MRSNKVLNIQNRKLVFGKFSQCVNSEAEVSVLTDNLITREVFSFKEYIQECRNYSD